jgi:hypothetical protein
MILAAPCVRRFMVYIPAGELVMRKMLVALVVMGGLALVVNFSSRGADEKPVAIKEVMKTAMKGEGLCK